MVEYIGETVKATQKIFQNYFENITGYMHDNRDIANVYANFFTKLFAAPSEIAKVQGNYLGFLKNRQELLKRTFDRQINRNIDYQPVIKTDSDDKRFLASEWNEYPYYFDFIKQNYLLTSKFTNEVIDSVEIEEKTKQKLNFYTQHYIDAFSPSNFLFSNPEALKLAYKTNGKSLEDGMKNFLDDIDKGRISQTDQTAFELGKNIAMTPGAVVFENELIQLIQYSPSTKNVAEIPLLILPPWINKFYILDLQEKNSFVQFLVNQGITVYMISWRNPTPRMGHFSFDDYVELGALKSIEVAKLISGSTKVNMVGYCLGGTLLGIALAVLAARYTRDEYPVNTATFLGAMIDFSDVGPMGAVIDQALVKKLERGELLHQGVMHGHDMERAFNLIRANDLIWSYVTNNYLKGIKPTAFDILFWTNDNTNLPAKMYLYYLRNIVLENKLSRKKALRICDVPIDIGKIEIPVFVIGMVEDHISPCETTFTTTELVSGPVEFILGGSGHVMGVANPPSKKKYGYFLNGKLDIGFDGWKNTANFFEGSWWTPWSERILSNSGGQVTAAKNLGNTNYPIIEPAPGRYVKEKAITSFPGELLNLEE